MNDTYTERIASKQKQNKRGKRIKKKIRLEEKR